jgi:hypothetical protein
MTMTLLISVRAGAEVRFGSKSEVDQSRRHVGLALKSRLELNIAAGLRWAKGRHSVNT